ncbi:hypothetical protein BUALT_Bualt14G0012600 [Buddleja alternifolia]|uniref:RING-CH-type domain-containing protein n=1 Tax=Buddleja alternifolia TaxID=168488 RepID=A0AAV6WM61_9LAMI|nr:hypothetical protein BUALT_Bualt14G0012600 [Buddleja alternifolia]
MVDEFMVCVDRIISSAACFQESPSSVNSNNNSSSEEGAKEEEEESSVNVSVCENNIHGGSVSKDDNIRRNLRECRICQEEGYDDDKDDMEAPCACNGTLKMFSPNYTSPPPKSNSHVMAIDIRQAWGPHVDLRDPRLLAFAAAERQFLQSEYDDYAIANSGTLTCFRSVAIILMLLLLIRQTLMVTKDFGMQRESSDFFHYQISILQLAGFLLPCYVVARSWYILQCRRRRQLNTSSLRYTFDMYIFPPQNSESKCKCECLSSSGVFASSAFCWNGMTLIFKPLVKSSSVNKVQSFVFLSPIEAAACQIFIILK